MTEKVTSDAVALIRSLADAEWAEPAVWDASLFANAALQANVIDLIARDPAELLRQLDGRALEVEGGEIRRLATKVLAIITEPKVVLILLLIGVYGLIFEFASPGMIVPGVVGTISLLLGAYALNLLPANYAGLGLLLVGIALLTVEAFNPTVVLGLGGIIGFLLGAIMLFRTKAPGHQLSWPVVDAAAAIFIDLIVVVLGSLRRARKGPVRLGASAMRGLPAEVPDWSTNKGHVFAQGERWRARGTEPLRPREVVEVANLIDLTVVVQRRRALTGEGGAS